jgi:hypothetical protein
MKGEAQCHDTHNADEEQWCQIPCRCQFARQARGAEIGFGHRHEMQVGIQRHQIWHVEEMSIYNE